MRYINIIALFAAFSHIHASPQDINFDLADETPDPTYTIDDSASAQTITYNPVAAAASIIADINSDGLPYSPKLMKRTNGTCASKPLGAGPVPTPDTASNFASDPDFAAAASAAPTPSGYTNTFTNLNASNNAYGYMGFTTLASYDSNACAAKCNAITGCMAINIFFERDATLDVGPACPNPPSTTNIKCVFWGGPVSASNANNYGYTDNQFQVLIAGSNGYVNNTVAPVTGYTGPNHLGNAAINAPLDCNGTVNTYLGVKIFTAGPFDPSLCAAACSATSAYNLRHPPATGSPKTCQFFNTYLLLLNGTNQGQYCAMYTRAWDNSYATNFGQYRGYDHYTVEYSVSYSNTTSYGQACPVTSSSSSLSSTSYASSSNSSTLATTTIVSSNSDLSSASTWVSPTLASSDSTSSNSWYSTSTIDSTSSTSSVLPSSSSPSPSSSSTPISSSSTEAPVSSSSDTTSSSSSTEVPYSSSSTSWSSSADSSSISSLAVTSSSSDSSAAASSTISWTSSSWSSTPSSDTVIPTSSTISWSSTSTATSDSSSSVVSSSFSNTPSSTLSSTTYSDTLSSEVSTPSSSSSSWSSSSTTYSDTSSSEVSAPSSSSSSSWSSSSTTYSDTSSSGVSAPSSSSSSSWSSSSTTYSDTSSSGVSAPSSSSSSSWSSSSSSSSSSGSSWVSSSYSWTSSSTSAPISSFTLSSVSSSGSSSTWIASSTAISSTPSSTSATSSSSSSSTYLPSSSSTAGITSSSTSIPVTPNGSSTSSITSSTTRYTTSSISSTKATSSSTTSSKPATTSYPSTLATKTSITSKTSSTSSTCTCAASATARAKPIGSCGLSGYNWFKSPVNTYSGSHSCPTREICAWKCLQEDDCNSISYSASSNTCMLYGDATGGWLWPLGDFISHDIGCFDYDCSNGNCGTYKPTGKLLPFLGQCSSDSQCACGRCLTFGKVGFCL